VLKDRIQRAVPIIRIPKAAPANFEKKESYPSYAVQVYTAAHTLKSYHDGSRDSMKPHSPY